MYHKVFALHKLQRITNFFVSLKDEETSESTTLDKKLVESIISTLVSKDALEEKGERRLICLML